MKRLEPSITQPSPSRRAVVRIAWRRSPTRPRSARRPRSTRRSPSAAGSAPAAPRCRRAGRARAEPLHRQHQPDGGVGVRQLLDRAQEGQRAGAGAAVLLGEGEREDAVVAEQLDGAPGELRLLSTRAASAGDPCRAPACARSRSAAPAPRTGDGGCSCLDQLLVGGGDRLEPVGRDRVHVLDADRAPARRTRTSARSRSRSLGDGASKPGARTAARRSPGPTPCPRNRTRSVPVPMKWSSKPASAAIRRRA